jgi:hypothetical protein
MYDKDDFLIAGEWRFLNRLEGKKCLEQRHSCMYGYQSQHGSWVRNQKAWVLTIEPASFGYHIIILQN